MFWITYKSHGGRAIAWPDGFATRELAQAKLDKLGTDNMHVIESDGEIEVVYTAEGSKGE